MVGDVTVAAPQASSEGYIRELRRGLRQVLGVLEDLIAKIEKIEKRLKELENAGTGRTSGPLPPGAARVAYNLEITPCANGSGAFEVSIDGGESFSLGPRLAGVLRFIASGDKERGGADPLVGWRSREQIRDSLARPSRKPFRVAYVNGMVNLLRKTLRKNGYDSNLIQTNKEKGVRLALKHSARGLPQASTPEW